MADLVIANKSELVDIADAIRAKTSTTDTLSLTEMPQMISNIETGANLEEITVEQAIPSISIDSNGLITASATQTEGYVVAGTKSATQQLPESFQELNFTVVGGTSQPSNPIENTIWVNTDAEITSWVFSATQPTGSEGMLWFMTNTSAPVPIDIMKENDIMLYPTDCKQYISGAWINKTANTYQSGEWKDWRAYIFRSGDGVIVPITFTRNTTCGRITTTNNYIYMYFENEEGNASTTCFCTSSKYNLKGYEKLCFRAKCWAGHPDYSDRNLRFFVHSSAISYGSSNSTSYAAKLTPSRDNTERVYTIDLSNLQGEYFFGCYGIGRIYVYDIWLE